MGPDLDATRFGPPRSLKAITMLAALVREQELALQIRATRGTGAPADEIGEVLMQAAVDAGFPRQCGF